YGNRAGVVRMLCDETGNRLDEGSQRALHVGSAASIKRSFTHGSREGIRRPLLERAGGHDIGMAGQAHEWCAIAAACPQVVHALGVEAFALKAEWREMAHEEIETARIIRRYRRPRDQLFRKLEGGDRHESVEVMVVRLRIVTKQVK